MKVHYFQRYHTKENVATANTILLLSRLYAYSSNNFFDFFKSEFPADDSDSFNPEVSFNLQEKGPSSVPDAVIQQDSFKVVVETKRSDWFYNDQLLRHTEKFSNEKHKVLLTLAPVPMSETTKIQLERELREKDKSIIHVNMTFEELAKAVQAVIDVNRDYEMQDILNDYRDYCYYDGLISVSDSWKWMAMRLANSTFDCNIQERLYYIPVSRGSFWPHDYLGLYRWKSIRAIGKIEETITASSGEDGNIEFKCDSGKQPTEEQKRRIENAIKEAKEKRDWNLLAEAHRYFLVERFYPTDFKKVSPRGAMGMRYFDLSEVLNIDKFPSVEEIAKLLSNKEWE